MILLPIILVTLFISCATQKVAEVTPTTPVESPTKIERKVWTQSYLPNFKVGDKINFYVGTEISLEGDFFHSEIFLDGVFHLTNNVFDVMKTVETDKPGSVIDLKKSGNSIIDMTVSFSKEDATYLLNFKLKPDKSYTLNGSAFILFKEKKYPVLATIKGSECKLFFDIEVETIVEKIEGKAEGNPVEGTQTIKVP